MLNRNNGLGEEVPEGLTVRIGRVPFIALARPPPWVPLGGSLFSASFRQGARAASAGLRLACRVRAARQPVLAVRNGRRPRATTLAR